ncbi:Ig-like domain repeat protein [Methanobrevibacter sp.]|uniref:Ig-like domain repeat protein n=1 Tax=Methanobrevibacter sp. TaxID=66852 RepID=UPI002E798599|nr:Ig-like domain repeat protein [Methanobrevibacter sp.]MEE0938341.1 Ig-like domain repeat protein [Methanobrevibacter sp.]
MENKKIFMIICFIICLFTITSVCASDTNQTSISNDEINQQLSLCDADTLSAPADDVNSDNSIKKSSEYNNTLNLNDNEEKFRENKENTVIVVSDLTTDYQKGDNMIVTLNDKQNQPIRGAVLTVALNGNKNYTTNSHGQITVHTKDLNATTYDVSINFAGNENYAPSSASAKITVNKIDSILKYNENLILDCDSTATMTIGVEGATGITAKIGNLDVEVHGFTILIPKLDVGTHNLYVTTIPDNNHNQITKTTTITVDKAECSISVENITVDYGSPSITVSSYGATKLIAKIDDKAVIVNGNDIFISNLDAGIHTLSVTAIPDNNHKSVTKTATLTVTKVDSSISIANLTLDYGSEYNITVSSVGVTEFTAKIDGRQMPITGNIITIPKLNVGNHTLTVTTSPDKNHNSVTKTATITVIKSDYLRDINDITLTYGSSSNIVVNSAGNVKFTAMIDDKPVTVQDNIIIIPKLNVGTHILTVSTIKNDNHNGVTKTAKITVNKAKTNLVTSDLNATVGQKINLTVGMGINSAELVNEGIVVFYESNTKIGQANVNRGIARLTYFPFKAGVYSIVAVFEATSKYESSSSTFKLTVLEKSNSIQINNDSIIIIPSFDGSSDEVTVEIKIPSDATGTITLTVIGKEYKSNIENGTCRIKLPNLKDGVYLYTITYSGDDQYQPFNDAGNFNVTESSETPEDNDGNSTIEIDFPNMNGLRSDCTFKMQLPSDATGNIILTINGNSYSYPVVNGVAMVKIPNSSEGYKYTVTYSGDNKYSSFTREGTLDKAKFDPAIIANNVNVIYSSGSYYSIKVYGTDGKLANDATVKITGKISQTLKTKNGIAKFKITQVPGTYKIKITALGKTVTKTITVKHLVTLKTVVVKKSAKKLVLQATLGKVNGKYLNKKTVTFKFNGKTYNAKTNAKGVAKVTIKSSVLKKLNVGKKVTYQATYSKDSVKKTVKINK